MSDEEWVTDSNQALELKLGERPRSPANPVRAEDDDALLVGADRAAVESFHPTFTYPIFGDQEKIFGYRDLDIKVCPKEGGELTPAPLREREPEAVPRD